MKDNGQRSAPLLYANEAGIARAAERLRNGGLVAFPTDTVYGVATLPWDEEIVARLYVAKQRAEDKPIPLLLSDVDQLARVAVIPPQFKALARALFARFWPGGLTVVLPKTEAVPQIISRGPNVAVRVPDLPLIRDLIRMVGGVLAVTSANLSGQPAPINAQEVVEQLGGRIDLILDGGPSPGGVPSTLLDCTAVPPRLLRRGAIPEAALRAVIGQLQLPERE